ncbi:hypothetical protein BJP40_07695 [Streptomyces sp. CC53]|nr:hypothetical protein BJP40_07695 [Streptomyces sp. CC53]
MAAVMVKQFRTAIVSLLRVLLALFGLRPSLAADGRTGAAAPVRPAVPAQRAVEAGGAAGRGLGAVRARALPPTMKQRIRAEAHGASPAVRRPVAELAASAPLTACAGAPAAPAGAHGVAGSSASACGTRGVPASAGAAAAPLSGGAAAL